MAFTYQMIDKESNELFEMLDQARRAAFALTQSTMVKNEPLSEANLQDLSAVLSKVNIMLTDMKRKIESLQSEANRNGL